MSSKRTGAGRAPERERVKWLLVPAPLVGEQGALAGRAAPYSAALPASFTRKRGQEVARDLGLGADVTHPLFSNQEDGVIKVAVTP